MSNRRAVMLVLHVETIFISFNEWNQLSAAFTPSFDGRRPVELKDGELTVTFHSVKGLVGPYLQDGLARYDSFEVDRVLST